MDTFTLMVTLILLLLLWQFQQNMLAFGIVILMILYLRSWSATFILLVALLLLFLAQGSVSEVFPLLVFGLVIVALLLGGKQKPEQPEYYSPDMMGMGGMGGGAGYG